MRTVRRFLRRSLSASSVLLKRLESLRRFRRYRLTHDEIPLPQLQAMLSQYREYVDRLPPVLRYRQAYFEINGSIAPGAGIPVARAWPEEDKGISYEDKLLGKLELSNGKGAEIGPLNLPVTSKRKCNVLYVDHLDTDGLRKKYQTDPTVKGIVEIDRPLVNGSLKETLIADAPLDYIVASQVFEHVPNLLQWLQEGAAVLRTGGLLAISLPDRRMTFDFLREETQ